MTTSSKTFLIISPVYLTGAVQLITFFVFTPFFIFRIKYYEEGESVNSLSDLNYIDSYNAIVGGIVTFLTIILGEHWILFVLFLLFNVIDFITGWMKARVTKKENSIKGFKGVIKKLGYWLIILVSFSASILFIEIGKVLKVDLSITTMLGWFVLASLAINEIRSIIENIVECGYKVPQILIKGLDIANKAINKKEDD